MPLSQINNASRSAIEGEFVDIEKNWSADRWLHQNNRYKEDPNKSLGDDIQSGSVQNDNLREYIAASSITHCLDGWSYLGRSIESHLKGDIDVSRHLGYYAELRAAMALLAAEGIGVFNHNHFVVTGPPNRRVEQVTNSTGTHKFVWEALEYWAQKKKAVDLIFKIIRPGGIPLGDWLNAFSAGSGRQSALALKWLREWGLDLKRLSEDREARNIASYNPTAFTSPRAMGACEAIQYVGEMWKVCEPAGSMQFPILDRYLLRNSLEVAFLANHGKPRNQAKARFEGDVDSMLSGLSLSAASTTYWEEFLKYRQQPSPPVVLEEAKGRVLASDPKHNIQVLARGTLLLRLASGACQGLLDSLSNFDRKDIKFWWSRVGEEHSLWHIAGEPDACVDLWEDVSDALRELQTWKSQPFVNGVSYYRLWQEQASAASVLGTCERIALWGLGL